MQSTSASQEVQNVSFSKKIAYVLKSWSSTATWYGLHFLMKIMAIFDLTQRQRRL